MVKQDKKEYFDFAQEVQFRTGDQSDTFGQSKARLLLDWVGAHAAGQHLTTSAEQVLVLN
jgi:hypothetical protein